MAGVCVGSRLTWLCGVGLREGGERRLAGRSGELPRALWGLQAFPHPTWLEISLHLNSLLKTYTSSSIAEPALPTLTWLVGAEGVCGPLLALPRPPESPMEGLARLSSVGLGWGQTAGGPGAGE